MIRFTLMLLVTMVLVACVSPAVDDDPLSVMRQDDGTVIWGQEYTFIPPGGDWQMINLDEDDFSFAFVLVGEKDFPCLTIMAYTEEPFGSSHDLHKRQEEFFKRYLWASRVVFDAPRIEETVLNGKQLLIVHIEGQEPVKLHKVRSKVVFMHRGERVVVFNLNQWRSAHASFDASVDTDFDRFVDSFRYLKPSFYEAL